MTLQQAQQELPSGWTIQLSMSSEDCSIELVGGPPGSWAIEADEISTMGSYSLAEKLAGLVAIARKASQ